MDARRIFSLSRSCQLQSEEQAAGPMSYREKTGFTGRTLVLPVIWMCLYGMCRIRGGSTGSKGQLIRITCAIEAPLYAAIFV